MYLAALVGENLYVSTYFIATADGVGGAHVKKRRQKRKGNKP